MINIHMRPFSCYDWMEYAGCETDEPTRAEATVYLGDKRFVCDIIRDGQHVQCISHGRENITFRWRNMSDADFAMWLQEPNCDGWEKG